MPGLDVAQVTRAVDALLNHVQRTKKSGGKEQLFEDADPISVLIGMKAIPSTHGRTKPHLVALKHPMMDPEESEVCLIVKDPQRAFKDQVEAKGIKCVKKVIGVSKLQKKYKQYEAKRLLCASYDLFVADDRVLSKLPHLIGKTFFTKKKLPLPLKLTRDGWEHSLKKIFHATPFYLAEGMCSTIKAAHTGMERRHIVENIVSAMDKVAELLPKKWLGVQAVHIKTHDSIALPVYHTLPTAIIKDQPVSRAVEEKSASDTPAGKRKAADISDSDDDGEESKKGMAKHKRFEKRAAERKAKKADKANKKAKTGTKPDKTPTDAKKAKAGSKQDKAPTDTGAAGAAMPSAVKGLQGKSPGKSPVASSTRAGAAAKKKMRAQ